MKRILNCSLYSPQEGNSSFYSALWDGLYCFVNERLYGYAVF